MQQQSTAEPQSVTAPVVVLEFVGTVVTVSAVAITAVLAILAGGVSDSDTNRAFFVSTYTMDTSPNLFQYLDSYAPSALAPTYFETAQGIYSTAFLGSYNWAMLLIMGLWFLCSFAVFTLYMYNDKGEHLSKGGKPVGMFARGGYGLTLVALAWNIGGLIFAMCVTWRINGSSAVVSNKYPMTTATSLLAIFASCTSIAYFTRELKEWYSDSDDEPSTGSGESQYAMVEPRGGYAGVETVAEDAPYKATPVYDSSLRRRASPFLRYGIAATSPSTPLGDSVISRKQYTPVLCIAWADALVLCDFLLLVGVIGTTLNVVAHEVGAILLCVLYASVAHSAFIRIMLDGYVNAIPEASNVGVYRSVTNAKTKPTNEEEVFHVRVMGFLANFSSAFLNIAIVILLLTRYASADAPYLVAFVSLVNIVPAIVWIGVNVSLDATDYELVSFRTGCLMEFIYNVLVRLLFVAMLIWGKAHTISDNFNLLDGYMRTWRGGGALPYA